MIKNLTISAFVLTHFFCSSICYSQVHNDLNINVSKKTKPNLIIILADDLGYSDIGCFGAKGFSTPNIDKMASEGIRFTDFYAAPTCSPARASLMTACYAQRLGIGRPINNPVNGLNPNEITIAEALKDNDYTTALIGKWHLGLPDAMSPVNQGFDYFSGIPLSQIQHGETIYTNGPNSFYRRQWKKMGYGMDSQVEYDPNDTLFTQRCTEEAIEFIRDNQHKPFFLYLAQPMVHKEVLASKDFSGKSEIGRFGDACQELDWSVGEILKTLKELDIDKNTLLIWTSDNGPWLNQGDQSGSARPLRGGKFSTLEGGVRVPCVMRWPGVIPEGRVCNEITGLIDVYPTFVELIGAKMPQDRKIDGKNIWPLITSVNGAISPHKVFYHYNNGKLTGIRWGLWKFDLENENWKLFNLQTDIGESHDIAKLHPDIVNEMQKLISVAREDLGDLNTNALGDNVRPIGNIE